MNISRFKYLSSLLAAFVVVAAASAGTLHVAPGGSGSGSSWDDPMGDIQAAIDAASVGDTILLAGGTYEFAEMLFVNKDVNIVGRDDCVLTLASGVTNRVIHVSGVSGGSLSGVTVTGGQLVDANKNSTSVISGGGLLVDSATGWSCTDCVFSNNLVFCAGKWVSAGDGGGAAVIGTSTACFTNCVFTGNDARGNVAHGGGLCVGQNAKVTLSDCEVSYNRLTHVGANGANTSYGGGIYNYNFNNANLAVKLVRTRILGNSGYERQFNTVGGIWNNHQGDALYGAYAMEDCEVFGNVGCGHAVYIKKPFSAERCTFWGNGNDFFGTPDSLTDCNTQDGVSAGENGNISQYPSFVFTAQLPSVADLYVAETGDDENDGTSTDAPFRTVTKALSVAESGTVVHIGNGTFTAQTGETFPWVLNDLTDVTLAGSGGTTIDGEGVADGLLVASRADGLCVSGIVFRSASRVTPHQTEDDRTHGGALGIHGTMAFRALDCAFEENQAYAAENTFGGAVGLFMSFGRFERCVFEGNAAGTSTGYWAIGGGGAVGLCAGAGEFFGCEFLRNSANSAQVGRGGAICVVGGGATLQDCILSGNFITSPGNRMGGAIYSESSQISPVNLVNCLVAGNTARTTGAGDGDALKGTYSVKNCTITGNTGSGKAVSVMKSFVATDSIFWGNGTDFAGNTVTLTNCDTQDGLQNQLNGNISADPLFENGFYLNAASPCIDAGGVDAGASVVAGLTTAADGSEDSGRVDIGYHHATGVAITEIYVSGTGDDNNNGRSPTAALRTLTKALTLAADEATIIVGDGTYSASCGETFPLELLDLNNVTIRANDGASPVVNGESAAQLVNITGCTSVTISGLSLINGFNDVVGCAYGGAAEIRLSTSVRITGCTITNNVAYGHGARFYVGYGGGIYVNGGSMTLDGCLIAGNQSLSNADNSDACGGGLYNDGSYVIMKDTLVLRNRIADTRNYSSQSVNSKGGGIYNNIGTLEAFNCLLAGNASGSGNKSGDGIFNNGSNGKVTLSFCTVAGNVGEGLCNANGTIRVNDSVVFGNGKNIVGTILDTNSLIGNAEGAIPGNPEFVAGYYLGENSVCIDAATRTAVEAGMASRTTSSEGTPDAGLADIGYHYASGFDYVRDLYVNVDGDDSNNGTSGTPLRTIARAIELATDGTCIHLGAGTYGAESGESYPLALSGKTNVKFMGDGQSPSVLDGSGFTQRIFALSTCDGIIFDNIVFANALNQTNSTSQAGAFALGGAFYAEYSGDLAFRNCLFTNNMATAGSSRFNVGCGGALFSMNSSIDFIECRFVDNKAHTTAPYSGVLGGALTLFNGGWFNVSRCVFVDNSIPAGGSGGQGGGLYSSASALVIQNSLMVGNSAHSGTASAVYSTQAGLAIDSSTFVDNAQAALYCGAALQIAS